MGWTKKVCFSFFFFNKKNEKKKKKNSLPLSLLFKNNRARVDAVPLVRRRREPFPGEHVPLVPAAVGAADLDPPHAHRVVLDARDRAVDVVVKRGPAAARVELGLGLVELGAAPGAVKGPLALFRVELVVLAGPGGLRAGLAEDVVLILFFCVCVRVGKRKRRRRRRRLRKKERKKKRHVDEYASGSKCSS